MKKYYEWESSEEFRRLDEYPQYVSDFIFEEISSRIQRVEHLWKPFPFQFEEKKKKISDFPFLSINLFAISERALAVLKELIDPFVEILPLNIENTDQVFYALNVVQTYGIDVARSDSDYDANDENDILMYVDVYAFPGDILPQAPIFRVVHATRGAYFLNKTYISDEFRKAVEANKLKGLLFDEEMKYRIGPKL